MSRREKKEGLALLIAAAVIPSAVMIGLSLLGARDELIAGLVVVSFAFTMLAGSFLTDGLSGTRR